MNRLERVLQGLQRDGKLTTFHKGMEDQHPEFEYLTLVKSESGEEADRLRWERSRQIHHDLSNVIDGDFPELDRRPGFTYEDQYWITLTDKGEFHVVAGGGAQLFATLALAEDWFWNSYVKLEKGYK
jgi:hypothetical protein